MTALPNHTCFSVVDSYGVELPFEVIDVAIVKFDLQDADMYSRYAVLVNGEYNKKLVKLANISGSWKEVGSSKGDAFCKVETINEKANRLIQIREEIKNATSNDMRFKLVKDHNTIVDFFSSYHISACKKLCFDVATSSII